MSWVLIGGRLVGGVVHDLFQVRVLFLLTFDDFTCVVEGIVLSREVLFCLALSNVKHFS